MNSNVSHPRVAVVGSLNVDLTATTHRLPRPGETIGDGSLRRDPGGKGANQAVAAARLGARVRMIGAVGDDADGRWLTDSLREAGVNTEWVRFIPNQNTGIALIAVDEHGENQISVCPGANRFATLDRVDFSADEAILTQLEVPMQLVLAIARQAPGFFALNAAPAKVIPAEVRDRADLIIVNETEYQMIPELVDSRLVAVTYGAKGAAFFRRGTQIAFAPALAVTTVSSVGAGDAFCAALVLALLRGYSHETALRAACAVGSAAVADPASQPTLNGLETYNPGCPTVED